jgi:hypothetical protein
MASLRRLEERVSQSVKSDVEDVVEQLCGLVLHTPPRHTHTSTNKEQDNGPTKCIFILFYFILFFRRDKVLCNITSSCVGGRRWRSTFSPKHFSLLNVLYNKYVQISILYICGGAWELSVGCVFVLSKWWIWKHYAITVWPPLLLLNWWCSAGGGVVGGCPPGWWLIP